MTFFSVSLVQLRRKPGWDEQLEATRLILFIFREALELLTLCCVSQSQRDVSQPQRETLYLVFSPPLLPPPFRCYIFFEWSVSTGSAQDEMSYLSLILIS